MTNMSEQQLETQLREEIDRAILGPVARVLGDEPAASLAPVVDRRAAELAKQLSSADPKTAATAAIAIEDLTMQNAERRSSLREQSSGSDEGATPSITPADAGRILGAARNRVHEATNSQIHANAVHESIPSPGVEIITGKRYHVALLFQLAALGLLAALAILALVVGGHLLEVGTVDAPLVQPLRG